VLAVSRLGQTPPGGVHTTGIQRGTGEEIECQFVEPVREQLAEGNGSICRGVNPSGKRLLDRVVRVAQDLAHAGRALTGSDPPRRTPDGTIVTADLVGVSALIKKLPVQLSLARSTDQRTFLFLFLRDAPSVAVREVANDPFGFEKLAHEIREGRFGAGGLIDKPRGYYTSRAVGVLAGVGIVGAAVYFAVRD
jgi:hypothetical protein